MNVFYRKLGHRRWYLRLGRKIRFDLVQHVHIPSVLSRPNRIAGTHLFAMQTVSELYPSSPTKSTPGPEPPSRFFHCNIGVGVALRLSALTLSAMGSKNSRPLRKTAEILDRAEEEDMEDISEPA